MMETQGLLKEAMALAQEALDVSIDRFGPTHVQTFAAMHQVAAFKDKRGDYKGAQNMYEQVRFEPAACAPRSSWYNSSLY